MHFFSVVVKVNLPSHKYKKHAKSNSLFSGVHLWETIVLYSIVVGQQYPNINLNLFQLSIGVAVLCLPWLRWAQPNLPRPIRVPLVFPIVYLIATVFVTVVPMYASPVETGYGILMILSSIPVYLVFIAWKNKPIWFQKSMGEL